MGEEDDYDLNDAWGDGGEEEEVTVVLGGNMGGEGEEAQEAKPEEAATT